MTTLQELEALVSDYQYIDNERVVLTVGIRASFYFWQGHTHAQRAAVVECIEAFEIHHGAELKWAFNADQHKVVNYASMPTLRQLVLNMDEDDQIEWYAASRETESVGEFHIDAITERGWQSGQMSEVSFSVPRDHAYIPEKRRKLLDLFQLFVEKLNPYSGHMGLCAVSTYEQHLYQSDEFDVATRYKGLYIEDSTIDVNQAQNGKKSINWITFIGKILAQRVGGIDSLLNSVNKSGIESKITSAGLIIATGTEPELVPLEKEVPPSLLRINSILRPLRNGNFGSMAFGSVNGEIRFNLCTTDLWIRRYDALDIWPPVSVICLPRAPVGNRPRKKIKLKTGETCSVHGRYRHPDFERIAQGDDDGAPQVVLLPGDVAPYWLKLGQHGEYLGRDTVTWELAAEL